MGKSDATPLRTAVVHLQAGEWEQAHGIVQEDETSPLSCWAHGIVHLQEGDVENARYWFNRAKRPFSKDVAAQLVALAAAVERDSG
jgi:predicted negative regulator of RcsB-dependent stress response